MTKREPKNKNEAMIFPNGAGTITIMQHGKPLTMCTYEDLVQQFKQKDTLLFVEEYKHKPSKPSKSSKPAP